jgi:hypothetical protein
MYLQLTYNAAKQVRLGEVELHSLFPFEDSRLHELFNLPPSQMFSLAMVHSFRFDRT